MQWLRDRHGRGAFALLAMLIAWLSACGGSASTGTTTTSAPSATPSATTSPGASTDAGAPHVMIIVLENREYSDVIDNSRAPYLSSLAARYGVATHAYSIRHPSQPNYLEMVSGDTQGVVDDSAGPSFDTPSLAGQLHAKGIDWRAYIGALPQPCYTGPGTDKYTRSHNPLMRFTDVAGDPGQCASVVPLDQLGGDLASGNAPAFLWVTPDLCLDGHDCQTDIVDSYMKGLIPAVQASSWYAAGGSIVITWDEGTSDEGCCDNAVGGHIPLIVVSAHTDGGMRSDTPVDHAGLLRTLEGLYGLDYLGHAQCACSGTLAPLLGG